MPCGGKARKREATLTPVRFEPVENRLRSPAPERVFDQREPNGDEGTSGACPRTLPADPLYCGDALAADDKHQFQPWACWQVGGYPRDRKGGDKGVDGWFNYLAAAGRIETGVISVKGGEHLNQAWCAISAGGGFDL